LNATHIDQICNTETCDSNTAGRAGRDKGDASPPNQSARGHEEVDGGHVLDHANHQASIGCPSAVARSSSGSTLHSCEYESLMRSYRWDCRRAVVIFGLRAVGIVGLRAVGIVGLRTIVSCRLETSPCRGGAAEIFNFESNTCNLFAFVQPPSAGSNNPATVSPAADPVNPSPQSGRPHLQSLPP
jgi:hypothetical protein